MTHSKKITYHYRCFHFSTVKMTNVEKSFEI